MSYRQRKLPFAFRIVAVGCVFVWLAAVSACSLEALFCCDSHDHANERGAHAENDHAPDTEPAVAEAHHTDDHHSDDGEAHHSHDSESHSHDSHKHDRKESLCCTTLTANVQTAKPFFFNNPVFQPIPFLCVLLETRVVALRLSGKPPNRRAKSRERVFTLEVCTSPGNRSHAPPAS